MLSIPPRRLNACFVFKERRDTAWAQESQSGPAHLVNELASRCRVLSGNMSLGHPHLHLLHHISFPVAVPSCSTQRSGWASCLHSFTYKKKLQTVESP